MPYSRGCIDTDMTCGNVGHMWQHILIDRSVKYQYLYNNEIHFLFNSNKKTLYLNLLADHDLFFSQYFS